jgi:hypothetical protein
VAFELARIDLPGTTVGTVPGTVPGVVRTVVLGATWGANLAAKSGAFRSRIGGPNTTATWKLSCRAFGEISAEGTWQASCRASRGLTRGQVSAVVCALTRAAICAAGRRVRLHDSRRGSCFGVTQQGCRFSGHSARKSGS